jgi:signal transduction histidine kinase
VRFAIRRPAPSSWLRLPRRTARLRLTVLYAGLFLVSGTVVLAITYGLEAHGSSVMVSPTPGNGVAVAPAPAPPDLTIVGVGPSTRIQRFPAGAEVQRQSDLKRLLRNSWIVLALSTLASALLGWIAAGRVLRPVRTITATAQTISAGNLHQRLALDGPDDEFKQLGDTLDELLGRLEASFEAQRRFVANASHELRTPLTLERTLLQVALADPDAPAARLRETCQELLEHGREQEQLLESLLTLASSERGLDHREPLDLSALAGRLLLTLDPATGQLSLQVETALAPAPISGDPALLERLAANLIDNAVHYNVLGGRIEVETASKAGRAFLSVINSGPMVPADEIDRLFEPFTRLGRDRTVDGEGHHGLGLSIVRAIATAHDATVTARPRAEGGLAVTVDFPAAP